MAAEVKGFTNAPIKRSDDKFDPSRAQSMGADAPSVDLTEGEYLMNLLVQLGPVRPSGMGGRRPADWQEIGPFGAAHNLTGWEMQLLRDMSVAFCEGLAAGESPLGINPLDREAS